MDEASPLHATLFGPPRLEWRGGTVEAASRKGQALLYVLSVHHGGMRRSDLAELLWGAGRVQNVRQELTALRALPGADEWLLPDDPVRLHVSSDVARFEAACQQGRYADAIELHRLELLPGLQVARAPAFADWLEVERQRLQDMLRNALRRHAHTLEEAAQYEQAVQLLDRLIALDPLDETSYRAAMWLSYKRGELVAGLDYYSACRRVLQQELGTEPLQETVELHARMVAEHDQAQQLRGQEARTAARSVLGLRGLPLQLARALALKGAPLPVEVLAQVIESAPREVAVTFEKLQQLGLLDGRKLAPPAVKSVRDAVPKQLSRYMHGRAARALATHGPDPAEVARHFLHADLLADASIWFEKAADAHIDALDFDAGKQALLRALWAAGVPKRRIELLLKIELVAARSADGGLRGAALDALEHETFLLQDDQLLIQTQLRRGAQLIHAGATKKAVELVRAAAASARRIGNDDLLAQSQHLVGAASFHLGDLDGARLAFQAVVQHGAAQVQLPALNNLGVLAGIGGDTCGALSYHEQALTVARQLGQRQLIAGVLNNLGATSERAFDYDRAARSFEEAARLFSALDDSRGEATVWMNVADLRLKQGKRRQADEALQRAAVLEADLDAPTLSCRLLLLQGSLRQSRLEHAAAAQKFQRALRIAEQIGDERQAAVTRFNLEMARRQAGQEAECGASRAALQRLEELGLNDVLPWVYAEMGALGADADEVRQWAAKLAPFQANPYVQMLALRLEARARRMLGDDSAPPGLAELEAKYGGAASHD